MSFDRRRSHRVDVPAYERPRPYHLPEPQCSVPDHMCRGARPMPATKIDVEELRGIIRHVESSPSLSARDRQRILSDALKRAVGLLDEGLAPSVTTWILGALHESGRWNNDKTRWFIHDTELYNWAMRQISEMHGAN